MSSIFRLFRVATHGKYRLRELHTQSIQHRLLLINRHKRLFCSIKPKKKTSTFRKWFKRCLLTFIASTTALSFGFYMKHRDEQNWRRSMKFWWHVYPLYFHYKFTDIYTKTWDESKRDAKFEELHEKYKYKIVAIIDELRGLYIKMGQMGAANIGNMYPNSWVKVLRKFEDDCPYEPIEKIYEIICNEYNINSVFDMFDEISDKPLGAASIGQTHYAKLKNGKEVVIKIQYPDAEQLFRGDLLLTRKFCEMAQPEHLAYIDEMEAQFLTEFDYTLEALNLEEIGNNLNDNPLWKDKVVVPRPYKEFCTKNCLVMEYLRGKKLITALYDNFEGLASERGQSVDEFIEAQKKLDFHPSAGELKRIERQIKLRDFIWNSLGFLINNSVGYLFGLLGNVNGKYVVKYKDSIIPLNIKYILDVVASVHGYELFINGAFNGDPHPGNLLILEDGRLGLIDYGQVKHLPVYIRIELAKLLIYIKRNDVVSIIKQVENMGLKTENMDPYVFEKVARFYFDCDSMEVTDGMNMLLFMEYLENRDPQLTKADDYVFPARLRMLISGLHWSLGYTFKASVSWNKWAQKILDDNDVVV
eukprot:421791_1